MLLQLGPDQVIFSHRMATDPGGFRLFDRVGTETRIDLGERSNLKQAIDGTLLLRHDDGIAAIDPSDDFARTEFREVALEDHSALWDAAFLHELVDCSNKVFARFEVDIEALEIGDPGYSGPTDAVLLPDRRRVAVMIARSPHIAVYDPGGRATKLIVLGGSYGSNNGLLRGRTLWVTNYDRLCRIDGDTLQMKSSTPLQPGYPDPKHGMMTTAFIGVPRYSEGAKPG